MQSFRGLISAGLGLIGILLAVSPGDRAPLGRGFQRGRSDGNHRND